MDSTNTDNRYRSRHLVSWQDIDSNGRFSLRAFANLMQEAAWQHAEILGFGFDYMARHDAVWVLVENRIQVVGQPEWRDEVEICTWHKGSRGALSYREYILADAQGHPLLKASSDWVLINHRTRRIVMPDILAPFQDTVVMEHTLPGFAIAEPAETQTGETLHKVCFSDLDFNGHVNNGRYYEWIADIIEPLNADKRPVGMMQVKYQSECFLGDEIVMRHKTDGTTFQVQGTRVSDNKKVFFGKLSLV